MSQVQSGTEAAAAALVGSLDTFTLVDVLDLLARTGHTGELQVVGVDIDRRVWVDKGDLVDAAGDGTLETSLFELACRSEGWFYFTNAEKAPEGGERMSISTTLSEVGPQVEEWRRLVEILPFEAMVCMSATPPGAEVQIRGDQWQLLSLVGNPGHPVRDVVAASPQPALATLRTLHELTEAGLVSVVDGAAAGSGLPESPLPAFTPGGEGAEAPPPVPPGFEAAEAPVEGNGGPVMPPPIAGDPWSSSVADEAKES